ncbi:M23 family metallopeptidase [Flavobacterium sp.]|uniref:M23 family metallopeptidase n=1 Tax=Flavobacterium sp. TaxID=239 RepID=UPI002B4B17A1|nr:M23 family metallopeptidase [Flavobacterium sp.]HLF53501.1 M23 family metallopeptidase [Flavobacterium sp.]
MRITFFFFIFYASIFAQNQYPKDYFRSPLDIPIQLSGNFGELRPNHFHAGFDFKTQKTEGLNIYAVADGYVSRIKISTSGYGKAIYITHPNGYTTVYGHLKSATPMIEKHIKSNHYIEKKYEIELFPKPEELIVKKGDIIAFSGNTGGSEGPHLHFEIRDSKTEKTINPLFFGFDSLVKDTKKPIITNLVVYPIDENATVNQSKNPLMINLSLQKDGTYVAGKVLASGKIGFGVNTYDVYDVAWDRNGVFKIESFLNGKPSFGFRFDTFAFDESRYINALIDYPRYKSMYQRVQKLFMKNPFPLSIIQPNKDNGIVEVVPNVTQIYRIEVSDFNDNKSVISVPIQYSSIPASDVLRVKTTPYFIKTNKEYNFEKDNMSVFIPAGTFYEDFYLDFDVKKDTLFFHNDNIAVHNNFVVSIQDTITSEKEKEKMFIASINGKKLGYNSTKLKKNTFVTYTKNLGQFVLAKDTTAPKISISKSIEGKWLSDQKFLNLFIKDDLSGIKEYNGYLNGQWILFEYDYKTRKITHNFNDGIVAEGKNDLKVVVSDNVGNSTIFETQFFRSQKQ